MRVETLEQEQDEEALAADADAPGVVLHDVPWEVYVSLRDLESNGHVRMTYLDGTLILMSPQFIHESGVQRLGLLVRMVAVAYSVGVAGTGMTTLRRKGRAPLDGSGKEPDSGFYVGANELGMRNKVEIDLQVDPPPDLAIEVDNKADSKHALPIYARLGVPEVWRYKPRDRSLWLGRFEGASYKSVDRSVCLPMLTPSLISQALDVVRNPGMGETDWVIWLLDWARGLPAPPEA